MKATIITIGDEILIGQIVDTNSAFIAAAFDKIGIAVTEMLSISDDRQHILDTLARVQDNADFVIVTGGLGPTKDDITKKTFCEYFDDHLVVDQSVLAHVTQLIERFYKRPITQLNKDQALVPSTCTVLPNQNGTAPGMWMQKGNTVFISLPGVPYEMKDIVSNVIIPKIAAGYKRPYIIHKTIQTYGMGESMVAERIEAWESALPEFVKLAYLPSPGRVKLRLTARGSDQHILQNAIDENVASLVKIIGDIIVGFDDGETIQKAVGKLLAANVSTIAVAESCTGGKIAEMLTSVPGASRYFRGGVVCYSAQSKVDVLGVDAQTIERFSVVSAEVALEMANRARIVMNTDYAIATTGNAGPGTDRTQVGVGVVFIALATPEGTIVEEFNFGQPREKVIDRAANKSLELLQKEILKNVQ